MKNVIIVCLLAAVACMCSLQASAKSSGNNLNFIVKDNVASLHSLNDASYDITPLELKPMLNSNQGVKLAAVCSITDPTCTNIGFNSGDNDINLDNSAQCRDEGFGTSCSSGYASSVPTNQVGETTNYCSNTCYYNLNYQELQVVICVINVVAQEFASNVIMIFNCYFKEQ